MNNYDNSFERNYIKGLVPPANPVIDTDDVDGKKNDNRSFRQILGTTGLVLFALAMTISVILTVVGTYSMFTSGDDWVTGMFKPDPGNFGAWRALLVSAVVFGSVALIACGIVMITRG